jgi:DNA-binding response OmpR family regulator
MAILDLGLPGMDGYQLARTLRSRWGEAVHLLALSGYGGERDRQRALDAGFDAHLLKPPDLDALHAVMFSPPGPRG